MAGDAPAPASGAPPIDYNAIIQQIMQGGGGISGPAAPATPAVNTNLPVASLLGEALGGGVSPLYPMSEAQQTQAGNAALLNFGINMLQNSSGPVRHSLGQAIASGLLGAQGSLAGVREGQAQMLDVQNKQQQMGLERLKAAMPWLMRQQAAGMPNPLLGGGGGGGGTLAATGAPIGGPDPAAALPKDQALAAIVQRESGGRNVNTEILDPQTGKPASSASGVYQMVDGTWQEAARLAGLKNPPPRAIDASRADQDAAASALYDKRGLQDWARSAPATAQPAAPAPYKVASTGATPPPPSGASTAPATAADDTFFPTAPKPNISTSPTLRGPGSAVPPTVTPPSPTIAQAGPPTVTPPAQPTPQQPTQADQPTPIGGQTWEQFLTQHMPQPTPEETATWHQAPDPSTLAEAAAAKTAAAQELSAARINFGAGSKEANTANERYQTASKEVGELQRQYSQTNATTLLDWTNKQKTLLAPLFKNQQDQAQAVAEADKQRAAAIALKTQEGQQAIDLANVNAGISTSTKLQEAYNTDAQNSGKRIDDLELLRGLSDNAGTPTLLTNIKIGDRSLADIISTTGFGGKDLQDKVGAVQAFRAGILNTVRELRSGGAATGEPRSNQDLQFVQDMAPNEWQNPATRSAIISFLQQVNQRRIDMAGEISRLTATRGTNGQLMPAGEAVGQARKNLPDFVQTMPTEAMGNTPAQVQARKDWFNTNVPPHAFFRYPNGRIDLYNGPGG